MILQRIFIVLLQQRRFSSRRQIMFSCRNTPPVDPPTQTTIVDPRSSPDAGAAVQLSSRVLLSDDLVDGLAIRPLFEYSMEMSPYWHTTVWG